jgi:hypothetical protein
MSRTQLGVLLLFIVLLSLLWMSRLRSSSVSDYIIAVEQTRPNKKVDPPEDDDEDAFRTKPKRPVMKPPPKAPVKYLIPIPVYGPNNQYLG